MRRFSSLLLMLLFTAIAAAEDAPLRQRIDQLVAEGGIGIQSGRCDDATFVRRIYLDLTNGIPTAAEARAFITNSDPDKRTKLIEALVADDRFNRRLVNFFDVMLMERRADKHVKSAEWRTFLLDSMRGNKPYNVLAKEILGADGADAKLRPAAKFFLDRDSEPNLMTRDIGRMLFGMDLQCAQCHDHPLVDDYYQRDYYGIYSFVNRTYVFDDKKAKKKFLAEKAEGDVDFKSVFTDQSGFARPRLPGEAAIGEPVVKLTDQWQVAPAKDVRPIPRYSRRSLLAERVGEGMNDAFRRNIVNRLWAMVMGRGIVEPVDLHHTSNPPSNPELLTLLADSFRASGYDIKAFVRELVSTETYQRSLTSPGDLAASKANSSQLAADLRKQKEQIDEAAKQADLAYFKLHEAVSKSREGMLPTRAERDKSQKSWQAEKKKADAAAKPLAGTKSKRDAEKKLLDAIEPVYAAAELAAKALADDKDLTAIAARLKARRDKHAGQLAAHEKALATQTAAANKANEAVTKALASYDSQSAKLEALDREARKLEAQLSDAESIRQTRMLAAEQARQRLEWAQRHLAQLEAQSSLADAEAKRVQTEQEAKQLAAAEAAMRQEVEKLKATLPKLEAEQKTLKANEASMRGALTESQQRHRAVKAFAAELTAIAKEIDEPEFVAALRMTESKSTSLAKAVDDSTRTVEQLKQQVAVAEEKLAALRGKAEASRAEAMRLAAERDKAVARRDQLAASMEDLSLQVDEKSDLLVDSLGRHNAVAELRPLTPEQLAWSMMQVGGMVERQVKASLAELTKKKPLDEAAKKDPAKVAARQREAADAARLKLAGSVNSFVKLYGGGAGQPQHEFFATVDQALFASNGGQMRGWFSASAGTLSQQTDPGPLAEELYLTVLTRFPTANEMADVASYLQGRDKDRRVAVEEMIWALATSVEFRFGH